MTVAIAANISRTSQQHKQLNNGTPGVHSVRHSMCSRRNAVAVELAIGFVIRNCMKPFARTTFTHEHTNLFECIPAESG